MNQLKAALASRMAEFKILDCDDAAEDLLKVLCWGSPNGHDKLFWTQYDCISFLIFQLGQKDDIAHTPMGHMLSGLHESRAVMRGAGSLDNACTYLQAATC